MAITKVEWGQLLEMGCVGNFDWRSTSRILLTSERLSYQRDKSYEIQDSRLNNRSLLCKWLLKLLNEKDMWQEPHSEYTFWP